MERKYWADFIRFFAVVLVVITHCHEQAGVTDVMTSSIFYTVDRLGVPLFLMLSGGFVLPRLISIEPLMFYKKRIPQFIFLLVFYSVLTNSVAHYFTSRNAVLSIINSITQFNGVYPSSYGGASQLWYLYTIIQLYLIAPFLAVMLKGLKTKNIIFFVFVCVLFNYLVTTIKIFEPSYDLAAISRMGKDFTGPFLVYFILGYLIMERNVLEIRNKIDLSLQTFILLGISMTAVFYDISMGEVNKYIHWYSTSIFIIVGAVPLFNILKYITINLKDNFIIKDIARCSFGIFLIHYAILYIIKYYVDMLKLTPIVNVFLYFVPTFTITYFVVNALKKNRVTRFFAF